MKKFKKTLLKITVILLILFIGAILFISNFHYSEGSRTGYLSKFSKKGYVFKTYEGELFVGGANADNRTVVNTTWYFSVPSGNHQVIDSLHKYEGSIVRLYYYSIIKNMPWQGDQKSFINKVEYVRAK